MKGDIQAWKSWDAQCHYLWLCGASAALKPVEFTRKVTAPQSSGSVCCKVESHLHP